MKKCSTCGEIKNDECFSFQNTELNKRTSSCKECKSTKQKLNRLNTLEETRDTDRAAYQRTKERRVAYARDYRVKYKDRTRSTNLKAKYGITTEDYNRMKTEQNNCCAICGEHEDNLKRILCVDHCHSTGNVRGLLCDTCNKFLGFYEKFSVECANYLCRCDCTHL